MKNSPRNITDYFKKVYYLDGSENELEKIKDEKSDDPYFHDAAQGIENLSLEERQEVMKSLNAKIGAKRKNIRSLIMPVLKLAAGLAFLVLGTLFIFNLLEQEKEVAIKSVNRVQKEELAHDDFESAEELRAKVERTIQEELSPPAAIETIDQQASAQQTLPNNGDYVLSYQERKDEIYTRPGTGIYKKPLPSPSSNQVPRTAESSSVVTPRQNESGGISSSGATIDGVALSQATPTDQKKSSDAVRDEVIAEEDDIEIAMSSKERNKIIDKLDQAPAAKRKEAVIQNFINGNVRGENGEALIAVNVQILGTSIGTTTDGNGNFRIPYNESRCNLIISYIGYEDKEVQYAGENMLNINLSPSLIALEEVQVTGGGADQQTNANFKFAKPATGWKEFREYVRRNQKYPQEAKNNKIAGRVIIEFYVGQGGKLSKFNVKKGLGFGCDEEAIRLLIEGPLWNDGKTDTKSEYTFRFK